MLDQADGLLATFPEVDVTFEDFARVTVDLESEEQTRATRCIDLALAPITAEHVQTSACRPRVFLLLVLNY